MDFQAVLTAVATVGFPIVACIALFYYIYKQAERHKEEIKTLSEMHKLELDAVTEALNNNSIVLAKLSEKIDVIINMYKGDTNG